MCFFLSQSTCTVYFLIFVCVHATRACLFGYKKEITRLYNSKIIVNKSWKYFFKYSTFVKYMCEEIYNKGKV